VSCHNTAAARATQSTHEWPMDQHSTASSERVHARTDAPDPQTDREEDSRQPDHRPARGAQTAPPPPSLHRPRRAAAREGAYPHRPPLLRSPLPPACALASVCVVPRRAQSSSLALRLQRHAGSSRTACAPARRHGAGGTGSSACGTLSRKARTARRAARRCCWRKSPAHRQVYRHSADFAVAGALR